MNTIKTVPLRSRICLVRGDITRMKVDAIVNAANPMLSGGGGVDGAIHSAAGPGLLKECLTLGGCRPGGAKITGGYNLFALHVIHTVGPVWNGGLSDEDAILAECYRNSLRLAGEHDINSIAFPAISTGAYGFPFSRATRIAISTIKDFLIRNRIPERVILVFHSGEAYSEAKTILEEYV